jgi:hypothetical protein
MNAVIDDFDDVGMTMRAQRLYLCPQGHYMAGLTTRESLECDFPARLPVLRTVDDTHSTFSDETGNLVFRDEFGAS